MKYLSLFSGIGGFEKGIIQAYEINRNIDVSEVRGGEENKEAEYEKGSGLHTISGKTTLPTDNTDNEHFNRGFNKGQPPCCVGYSEIDKYACQVYEKHFPNHTNYGDITHINEKELPDFDLLVGGVPCQSWSVAGKRGGFEDPRGNMWFESIKILRAKRPKYFLFENVKGLLSHDRGKSMERICEELCESGYAIDFDVLNSKNFGVPQNRERVFIFGVRIDLLDECQIF